MRLKLNIYAICRQLTVHIVQGDQDTVHSSFTAAVVVPFHWYCVRYHHVNGTL